MLFFLLCCIVWLVQYKLLLLFLSGTNKCYHLCMLNKKLFSLHRRTWSQSYVTKRFLSRGELKCGEMQIGKSRNGNSKLNWHCKVEFVKFFSNSFVKSIFPHFKSHIFKLLTLKYPPRKLIIVTLFVLPPIYLWYKYIIFTSHVTWESRMSNIVFFSNYNCNCSRRCNNITNLATSIVFYYPSVRVKCCEAIQLYFCWHEWDFIW